MITRQDRRLTRLQKRLQVTFLDHWPKLVGAGVVGGEIDEWHTFRIVGLKNTCQLSQVFRMPHYLSAEERIKESLPAQAVQGFYLSLLLEIAGGPSAEIPHTVKQNAQLVYIEQVLLLNQGERTMLHILLHDAASSCHIKYVPGMRPRPILNQAHQIELQEGIVCIVKVEQGSQFIPSNECI